MNKIRYFIGIPLPHEVSHQIHAFAEEKKNEWAFAKWTHPHDYHITIAFLGDLELDRAASVRELLSNVALKCDPFTIETDPWGCFGPAHRPSILWAGVKRTNDLDNLYKEIWQTIAPLRFEPEHRPFKPHITVARRSKGTTAENIAADQGSPVLSWQADHAALFQTHFGKRPAYETVLNIPFQS